MISSTSFLITAFTAFSRLLGYSHSWHHPRAIRRGPTTTFLAFPQSWEVILFLLKASSIIFRYMLADPQCIYLQYTLLRPLWMPPGDCSACSSFIENIPSSQTFIRTQSGYTICTKHSSKFCPQEVIAFDMSKVSVCCLICRLSIFGDHYFYYWPLKFLFIYLAELDLHCWARAPPVAVRGGCSPTEVLRLLTVVASPVAEHGL